MTTIELHSGMSLPTGTRHAGLDRLTAAASLAHRLLGQAIRAIEVRRARIHAVNPERHPSGARGPRPYDSLHAHLPRGLGD